MCNTRGRRWSAASRSAATKPLLAPHGVDEPTVLASHVDDQRLAGCQLGVGLQGRHIDIMIAECLRREPAENVVTDPIAQFSADA